MESWFALAWMRCGGAPPCAGAAPCNPRGRRVSVGEMQVQLSSDSPACKMHARPHQLSRPDSLDITHTPRVKAAAVTPRGDGHITPRQRDLRDGLELPTLRQYPVPPTCNEDDSEEQRWRVLLEMYQDFALEMNTGAYLTQLTSNRDYSDIHCQLMEDLQILKLDQSNGRIIEFPLTGVSKVYRIVKSDDKWYSAGSLTGPAPVPPLPLSKAEHIVVVEFMKRKLAFVFKEMQEAQKFMICMELLTRRAQQKMAGKELRPGTPSSAPRGHFGTGMMTPRQVREGGTGVVPRPRPAPREASRAAADEAVPTDRGPALSPRFWAAAQAIPLQSPRFWCREAPAGEEKIDKVESIPRETSGAQPCAGSFTAVLPFPSVAWQDTSGSKPDAGTDFQEKGAHHPEGGLDLQEKSGVPPRVSTWEKTFGGA